MVGYCVAARGAMDVRGWMLMLDTLVGTALTAAGASALNQYLEREYDGRMRRTAGRPLPAGRVAPQDARLFGMLLGISGVLYLALFVNLLTAALGAFTLGTYVLIYTPMKRSSTLCTICGAVPGAIPPVMGWTAFHAELSPEALALFGILFLWQMPHFMAIAILYRDDYAAGGFKMLPVVDPGLHLTGRQIVVYSMALIPATLIPYALGMAGPVYFAVAALMGVAFLGFAIICATTKSRTSARKLFLASIIYLPLLLAMLVMDGQ